LNADSWLNPALQVAPLLGDELLHRDGEESRLTELADKFAGIALETAMLGAGLSKFIVPELPYALDPGMRQRLAVERPTDAFRDELVQSMLAVSKAIEAESERDAVDEAIWARLRDVLGIVPGSRVRVFEHGYPTTICADELSIYQSRRLRLSGRRIGVNGNVLKRHDSILVANLSELEVLDERGVAAPRTAAPAIDLMSNDELLDEADMLLHDAGSDTLDPRYRECFHSLRAFHQTTQVFAGLEGLVLAKSPTVVVGMRYYPQGLSLTGTAWFKSMHEGHAYHHEVSARCGVIRHFSLLSGEALLRSPVGSARRMRLHALLAHLCTRGFRAMLARVETTHSVAHRAVTLFLDQSEEGVPLVRLATHERPDQESTMERLTGISECSLISAVGHYDWRNGGEKARSRWFSRLVRAGGRRVDGDPAQWEPLVADFYRKVDPVLLEEARLSSKLADEERLRAQEVANAQALARVREILRTGVGHKNGWSRRVAELMGIHPTNVKRWIQKEMPAEFARLYPASKGALAAPSQPA
jgi:hypothetical protein